MSRIERKLNLGDVGAPLGPTKGELARYGIEVDDSTIYKWRTGASKGDETATRIGCVEVLQSGSSEAKDRFIRNLVSVGLNLRSPQKNLAHRFNSEGFTESIGSESGVSGQDVRRFIRALRTDVVLEILGGGKGTLLSLVFGEVVEDYFRAYTDPDLNFPSQIPEMTLRLREDWDGSIPDFYSLFYRIRPKDSGRMIAPFVPYEVEFFGAYIDAQRGLTIFDRRVLESGARVESLGGLAKLARTETDIPLDKGSVGFYRRVLLVGEGY